MRVLLQLLLLGVGVEGFKLKTHVYIANRARAGALKGLNGSRQVQLGLMKANITNRFVLEAIQDYPDIFRAGVLGPDCFPDLIAGQVFVHVNKGAEGVEDEKGGIVVEGGFKHDTYNTTASDTPFEDRSYEQWRSIDNGMALLKQAWRWNGESIGQGEVPAITTVEGHMTYIAQDRKSLAQSTREELFSKLIGNFSVDEKDRARTMLQHKQQALAFAYGVLGHMSEDGFAHSFVNEWAGATFNLMEGSGLYLTVSEEIKHNAVEAFVDKSIPEISHHDIKIAAPHEFLKSTYETAFKDDNGKVIAEAGELAGTHYVFFAEVQKSMLRYVGS